MGPAKILALMAGLASNFEGLVPRPLSVISYLFCSPYLRRQRCESRASSRVRRLGESESIVLLQEASAEMPTEKRG